MQDIVAAYNATRPGAAPPPVTVQMRAWYNPNLKRAGASCRD